LKIIVDVGVGLAVERVLRESGHDVLAVRDVDPASADGEILRMALQENRLLITMDKDFGELVYRTGLKHTGVLLLRLEDATGEEKAGVIRDIFEQRGVALPGRFSVYQAGHLRIRKAHDSDEGSARQVGSTGKVPPRR
jgi:predicted nuclease of predicted toxin-antitoxin system